MRTLRKSVTVAPPLSFDGPITPDDIIAKGAKDGLTLYLDDDEEVPHSMEKVEELLAKDAEKYEVIVEKAAESDGDLLDTLTALSEDDSKEAAEWKKHRMEKEEA